MHLQQKFTCSTVVVPTDALLKALSPAISHLASAGLTNYTCRWRVGFDDVVHDRSPTHWHFHAAICMSM